MKKRPVAPLAGAFAPDRWDLGGKVLKSKVFILGQVEKLGNKGPARRNEEPAGQERALRAPQRLDIPTERKVCF